MKFRLMVMQLSLYSMVSVAAYWAFNGKLDNAIVLFLAILYLLCKSEIDDENDKNRN